MAKNPNFGATFGPFTPNLRPQNFLGEFYLDESLNIVPGDYLMQFKEKLIRHTWENIENLIWGPILTGLV